MNLVRELIISDVGGEAGDEILGWSNPVEGEMTKMRKTSEKREMMREAMSSEGIVDLEANRRMAEVD